MNPRNYLWLLSLPTMQAPPPVFSTIEDAKHYAQSHAAALYGYTDEMVWREDGDETASINVPGVGLREYFLDAVDLDPAPPKPAPRGYRSPFKHVGHDGPCGDLKLSEGRP